jgi:CheY-like chemotaxis protein
MMGSKIQLKSKYGVGSRFYFTIKQRVIEKEGIGNFIAKYNEQLDKKTNYRVSFEAPEAAILVVDDNEMNLLVTKKLLENTKMKIDTRKSGMECLEAVGKNRYNLILMDVKMPEMDGIETLKRIRGGALLNRQTPVIALTADATRGVREKYLDDGFNDYISKPFDPIKLEKKIMRFIPNTLIRVQSSSYTSERKMSYLLNVNEGLKYCSGDMDMYNEVLAAYLKLGEENIKSINKCYQDVDWENYDIHAHSLKSTSQTVGAVSLYEMAKKLEEAAKKKDTSYIIYNHEKMINTYKSVLDEIQEYFRKEGKEIKKN